MSEDLFCKIFVMTEWDRNALLKFLAEHFDAELERCSVEAPWGTVDVIRNDDVDITRVEEEGGFLYFPYLIETEPDCGFERQEFVQGISSLLKELRKEGLGAVVACDFEDELS